MKDIEEQKEQEEKCMIEEDEWKQKKNKLELEIRDKFEEAKEKVCMTYLSTEIQDSILFDITDRVYEVLEREVYKKNDGCSLYDHMLEFREKSDEELREEIKDHLFELADEHRIQLKKRSEMDEI